MGIVEGEGECDGHLFWIVLLVVVGLNSSGHPDRGSSCWKLVLRKEVRLLMGLRLRGRWLVLGRVRGRDVG